VELEDAPTLGRFAGIIEIDRIDDQNELNSEGQASREATMEVAKEPDSLGRVQLGRTDFY
jgi:hypothetical protein